MYGNDRAAQCKTPNDVCASRNRCQVNVWPDLLINVIERFGRQRRSRREHTSEVCQTVRFSWGKVCLSESRYECRTRAENSNPFFINKIEQYAHTADCGTSIIEHDGG